MTITDALADRNLFAASEPFRDLVPWRPWLTFTAATYGLGLDPTGRELFTTCTGRSYDPPPGGWREVIAIVGRQAGKTRTAATIATFEAIAAPPSQDGARWALLLAQDHRAALRTAFSYCKALLGSSPLLRRAIVSETASTITLENGVTLAAYPCRPAAVRGLRALVVVVDELAFFKSSEMLPQDVEMLRAVRPTLAMTGGRLVVLSSPHAQAGALWELHRRYYGQAGASVLVWQASAPMMNPCLSAGYLERMRESDPEAYRAEVEGRFRDDVASYVTREALEACVIPDRRELPPTSDLRYIAFTDPSGGSSDSMTLAIAHREGERVVLDLVRERRPPFSPDDVVREYAETVKRYRCASVTGDSYGGQWPRERFAAHGVRYLIATKTRSELYATLLPLVNAQRLELLDDRRLVAQLLGLERRVARGGRESIDHGPGTGAHDDVANAVAGAVVLATDRPPLRSVEEFRNMFKVNVAR